MPNPFVHIELSTGDLAAARRFADEARQLAGPIGSPLAARVAPAQAAGLVETLQGQAAFPVFAPTDEAFAKLPSGTV